MISEHALPSSLTKQHPLKVFSFRTQGSHLLWNLIEGLFINFHSPKFLLQRKRWHTKSEDMGQRKCLFRNEPPKWGNKQAIKKKVIRERAGLSRSKSSHLHDEAHLDVSSAGQFGCVTCNFFQWTSACTVKLGGSTAFSGSALLSTATVVNTLFKSCHTVYSEWPSPSLCGNLKTKHHTGTASVKYFAP